MTTHDDFIYKFDENICNTCDGDCCIGQSGAIWINEFEIIKLSLYLRQSIQKFKEQCLTTIAGKYSIKEVQISKDNFRCLFFDLNTKRCSIYIARPSQCRTFPFWNYYQNNIEELISQCKAVVV